MAPPAARPGKCLTIFFSFFFLRKQNCSPGPLAVLPLVGARGWEPRCVGFSGQGGGGGAPSTCAPPGSPPGLQRQSQHRGAHRDPESLFILLYFVAISETVGMRWGLFQNLLRSVPGKQKESEGRPGRSMAIRAVPTALRVAQNQDLGLVAAGGGPSAWSQPRPWPGTEAPPRGPEARFLGKAWAKGCGGWFCVLGFLHQGAESGPLVGLAPAQRTWALNLSTRAALDPCREMMGEGKPAPPSRVPAPPPPRQPTPTPPLPS